SRRRRARRRAGPRGGARALGDGPRRSARRRRRTPRRPGRPLPDRRRGRGARVKLGLFLPVSGRAATRETLMSAAQQAEAWGFDSIWAADRIVIPWRIEPPYAHTVPALLSAERAAPSLESR